MGYEIVHATKMPKANLYYVVFSCFFDTSLGSIYQIKFYALLTLYAIGFFIMANGQNTWCIANPSSSNAELMANLDYACSHVDCHLIQQGSRCFHPNTYAHHASFAMNLYYQNMGRHTSDCDFRNSGLISLSDPSYGRCTYESGGALEENQTSGTWCVAKPTTDADMLQEIINFACSHVDCSPIKESGGCFNPTTLLNHASFAMNLYYQAVGRTNSSCNFSGNGLIVSLNPSYDKCMY